MPRLTETTEQKPIAEGDNYTLADCPMCDSNAFAFLPEIGYLVCWKCKTGFLPHEFIALTKSMSTAN